MRLSIRRIFILFMSGYKLDSILFRNTYFYLTMII